MVCFRVKPELLVRFMIEPKILGQPNRVNLVWSSLSSQKNMSQRFIACLVYHFLLTVFWFKDVFDKHLLGLFLLVLLQKLVFTKQILKTNKTYIIFLHITKKNPKFI